MAETQKATELIQRGQAAALVGRHDEARDYLRRAVEIAPERVDAWLALAGVEDEPQTKIDCFQTVLSLEPDNVEARLGLEMIQPEEVRAPESLQDEEDAFESLVTEASRRLEEAVGPPPAGEVPPDDAPVPVCANHPNRETMLRCNRCNKPICPSCARQTPVGYRCKECLGRQQSAFYSGGVIDYVIGGVIGLVLGGAAGFLMTLLGAWFFALILGPVVGIGIAELVRLAVRRRRSLYLWAAVGGGMIAGSLPALLLGLSSFSLWSLLTLILFLVLSVGAAVARLR